MNARDEIREQIRTRLVGYVDTSDAEAVRLLDTFAAEVLRDAADEVVADADRLDRALKARTETAATKRSVANDLRRRADEIGGA